jgi:acyl-CoA dehydrogenase
LMIVARTIGAATRAVELATAWARERMQGGRRLIEHQMIAAMLADAAAEIAANRALTHQLACEFDRGGDRKTLHAKAAMLKLPASEASNRIVDCCVQILGGRGCMREQPVEPLWRELRLDRIWEGTPEIQRHVIANEIDKRGLEELLEVPGASLPPRRVVALRSSRGWSVGG